MFFLFNNGCAKFILQTKKTRFFSTIIKTADKSIKNVTKTSKYPKKTVSYLMNSYGLSLKSANYVSDKVEVENFEIADSVMKLLKNYGFSKTQISFLVLRQPELLLSEPEKTLLPRLDFFRSFEFSEAGFSVRILSAPQLLLRSLEDQLIPSYRFLKSVFHCDDTVFAVMKRHSPWIFDSRMIAELNIAYLSKFMVPGSSIELLMRYPNVLLQKHERFRETVDKVREMGFDPRICTFVLALRVLSGTSKKGNWDQCFEAYKKWGLSVDNILLAFHKHPICMLLTEKTIDTKMDFLVNKMGYGSKGVVDIPSVLFFNLEKRIIPRCSVIQVLTSKGLLKNVSLCSVLIPVEKRFLERFVTRYEEKLPQLMSVYRGKLNGLKA